jgi:hypothetical protein
MYLFAETVERSIRNGKVNVMLAILGTPLKKGRKI